jgi:hypothetical protein
MHRFLTFVLTTALFAAFSFGLTGCDETPSSVEDFPIQGTMDSPGGLTVSLKSSPEFEVSYQGLKEHPTAELVATGDLQLEQLSQEGDPEKGGSTRWRVSLATQQIDPPIKNIDLVIKGDDVSSDRIVTDTVSTFATTKLSVETDFTSSFATFADYEGDVVAETYCGADPDTEEYTGDQRVVETSGANTTVSSTPNQNNPVGSNGVSHLQIENTEAGGSVTIQRRMNLPNSDEFSFLVRSANSQRFNLTLGFTEESNGSEVTREFTLPVPQGIGWLKVGIPFSEISADLNPVDTRSGGNGPLVSITLTADAAVNYAVDEMTFGTQQDGPRAEFHDFDQSPCAYGPPFSGGTFGFTNDVAAQSDGYTARTLEGIGFFGYNQPPAYLDVDENDVLTFMGKGVGADRDLFVFLEGPGNFTSGNGLTKTLPQGQWKRFEIPLGDLGDDPSALIEGLGNVGFNGCDNCVVDDLKIMPRE